MRAVIQRVKHASVKIDGEKYSSINKGLLVLLGIEEADTDEDIEWLANKICSLRIFDDENGVMNFSVDEIKGEILIVSQFTLYASTKKGNRPSYIKAAKPEISILLYERFVAKVSVILNKSVGTGKFGAGMEIDLLNWGPVTITIDSKQKE